MLIIENMIWRSSRSEGCIGVRVTQYGSRHQTIILNNSECKHLIYTRIYLKKWFSMCDIGYALIFGLASHQSYETGTSRKWLWAVFMLHFDLWMIGEDDQGHPTRFHHYLSFGAVFVFYRNCSKILRSVTCPSSQDPSAKNWLQNFKIWLSFHMKIA